MLPAGRHLLIFLTLFCSKCHPKVRLCWHAACVVTACTREILPELPVHRSDRAMSWGSAYLYNLLYIYYIYYILTALGVHRTWHRGLEQNLIFGKGPKPNQNVPKGLCNEIKLSSNLDFQPETWACLIEHNADKTCRNWRKTFSVHFFFLSLSIRRRKTNDWG